MKGLIHRGPFDVVYADPPWAYFGSPKKMGAAGKHYELMSDEQLLQLPVRDLLTDRGVLFLWATSPRLDFAVDLIRSWGLSYRGVAFVWVKTRKDGAPIGAQGVRPSIVKPTTEFVLSASPVKRGRPMRLGSEAVPQVVMAPRREHSRKHDEVRSRIEILYPLASRLELLARTQTPGWICWGDQVDHFSPGLP